MKFTYLFIFAFLFSFGMIIFGDRGLVSVYRLKVKKEILEQDIAQLEEKMKIFAEK